MRTSALLALVILALVPAWASAQVAAPSLIPVTPGVTDPFVFHNPSFVPENPAVMRWQRYSVGGGGITRAEMAVPPVPGQSGVTYRLEHSYGGLQWNGEAYSFAVDQFWMSAVGGNAEFDVTIEQEGYGLALARSFGGWLAIGAAHNTDVQRVDIFKSEKNGTGIGASFRIFETWYLGAVLGQEDVSKHWDATGITSWSDTRTVTTVGVGYLSNGPWRLHLELWTRSFGEAGASEDQGIISEDVSSVVIEASRGQWVAGLTVTTWEEKVNNLIATATTTSTGNEFSFGVAPEKGFSLLFHYGWVDGESDDGVSSDKLSFKSAVRSLSLAWIF